MTNPCQIEGCRKIKGGYGMLQFNDGTGWKGAFGAGDTNYQDSITATEIVSIVNTPPKFSDPWRHTITWNYVGGVAQRTFRATNTDTDGAYLKSLRWRLTVIPITGGVCDKEGCKTDPRPDDCVDLPYNVTWDKANCPKLEVPIGAQVCTPIGTPPQPPSGCQELQTYGTLQYLDPYTNQWIDAYSGWNSQANMARKIISITYDGQIDAANWRSTCVFITISYVGDDPANEFNSSAKWEGAKDFAENMQWRLLPSTNNPCLDP